MKLKKELEELKLQLGMLQKLECTEEQNAVYRTYIAQGKPLPTGIFTNYTPGSPIEFATFYTIQSTALSKEELAEYIQYKQLRSLITIKRCVVFFTVLTIISLICSLVLTISIVSGLSELSSF